MDAQSLVHVNAILNAISVAFLTMAMFSSNVANGKSIEP